ncbi:hypothetical protein EYR40_000598 [Pleurotus pulmonarius]|nr:hypothetical protein EYR36_004337 [Pleurotus pulmonarius]KAF4603431.1 hypothetical protein EYR38_003844 [Pleurotus pulmonarius]KAF4608254.1 hypothetical protein EYR40_000598 [Pleurotus pulmonarius]
MARASFLELAKVLILSGAFIKVAAQQAQTSLFIPGFDPQPLSADAIGVDGEGRTTWALQAGQATDPADIGIPPSATITYVAGPSNVGYTMVFTGDSGSPITVAYDCSLSGNEAVCSAEAGGETATATLTQDPFLVQVGTTLAANAPTSAPVAGSSSPAGSSGSGSASTTSSGSPAPATQSNASRKTARVCVAGLSAIVVSMVAFW